MSELLIELFSEEIPARMQARAAEDLRSLVVKGLAEAGIAAGEGEAHATPRRLALVLSGLARKAEDVVEERKGPRVGAPDKALEGFLRAAGLGSIGEAEVVNDPKKGDFYVARIEKTGRATRDILAELVPDVIARFPWPKSMRWGSGKLAWVRPLQGIVCIFDGKVVPFEVAGIESGATTRGHRFLAPEAFGVADFKDYRRGLKAAKVLLDARERAEEIAAQARKLAQEAGLRLVEEPRLLEENAGLVEWPVVLMGRFREEFLEVPPEVLMTSMKAHQKCFSLWDPKTGKLASRFILVSNMKATDKGAAIIAGNERVIEARLSDARFFWRQDLARRLEPMHFELKSVTYHERLGTQWERMERVRELARAIAPAVDAEADKAGRAAELAKADLVSGMVGEFPELQGLMGRYYAEAEKIDGDIAHAIEEHYMPRGAADEVPTRTVSVAVALADKLDLLTGFWAIGDKPTGSGDPYQLRRAALGVIRICIENDLRLGLTERLVVAMRANVLAMLHTLEEGMRQAAMGHWSEDLGAWVDERPSFEEKWDKLIGRLTGNPSPTAREREDVADLLSFFIERLKVYLRDQGARHDLIDAILAVGAQDDIALIVKRLDALGGFLETEDGANLLAGVKRAANILRIEEKKDGAAHDGPVEARLLVEHAERELDEAIAKVELDVRKANDVENFTGAMRALAELRAPVDAFFERVKVNADDAAIRANRLRLLNRIRAATHGVAEFSRIEG